MNLQEKMIRANIIAALRMMGGHDYDIIRRPRDPNGQPSGEPETVGRLFGCAYVRASDGYNLHIDLPGVITTDNNSPAMAAVLLCGEAPQEGDTIACGKKSTEAVRVYPSGPIWSLALRELV